MRHATALSCLVIAFLATAPATGQTVWHVDADAASGGDGLTWATAFNDLQDALASAIEGDEVWVAEGLYKADSGGGSTTASFALEPGRGVYGGFFGDETERWQRDWFANATVLSGDLNDDDHTGNLMDNSRRIVTTSTADSSSVLSGFVITAAYSTSSELGSAVFNDGGSPFITDCTFIANTTRFAAAVYNGGGGDLTLLNCAFLGNVAHTDVGGGLVNVLSASATLVNCVFSGNRAQTHGAAIYAEGQGVLSLITCTLSGNDATGRGGGIRIGNDTEISITNSVLWGNTDSSSLGDDRVQISGLDSTNLWTISHACIEGWTGALGGSNNTGMNPRFVNAAGPDGIVGTMDDDVRLDDGSPCIDAADHAGIPVDTLDLDHDGDTNELIPFDISGNARYFDDAGVHDTGSGMGELCDLGALERSIDSPTGGIYIGPKNGSWFEPANWMAGQVPDAQTDVILETRVVIDQPNAIARSILVTPRGRLEISASGGLDTVSVEVLHSGVLNLNAPDASITLDQLVIRSQGALQWSGGSIELRSGLSFVPHDLVIGEVAPGSLMISSDAALLAPQIEVSEASTLGGAGVVNANVINFGLLEPGEPLGTLTVNGSFVQSASGLLHIDFAGYTQGGDYDQLNITGPCSIAGTIELEAWEELKPIIGSSHEVLVSPELISGTFDVVTLPEPTGGAAFHLRHFLHAFSLLTVDASVGAIIYVDADAPAGGDGLSWATAFNTVHDAWSLIDSDQFAFAEVWVSEGVYVPTFATDPNDPRSATLFLSDGVEFLGGFSGVERHRHERDWVANPTILSGDIGVVGDPSDNCYTVLTGNALDETHVFDGFTIRDGQANSATDRGGGIVADGGGVIRNCRIVDNFATWQGGGAYLDGDMVFFNTHFENNIAQSREGGAVYGRAGHTISFFDCTFTANYADFGGSAFFGEMTAVDCAFTDHNNQAVIAVGDDLIIRRCYFEGNSWLGRGGAVLAQVERAVIHDSTFVDNSSGFEGGALHITVAEQSAVILGCTFLGNHADRDGGGLWVTSPSITIANSAFSGNSGRIGGAAWASGAPVVIGTTTFSRNSASTSAGALHVLVDVNQAMIANSVFWNNDVNGVVDESAQIDWGFAQPRVDFTCIHGLTGTLGGVGNIGLDPRFVDDLGSDLQPGTVDDDIRLSSGSPCIDAASNSFVASDLLDLDDDGDTGEPLPFDADGDPRFFDDPRTVDTGSGTPPLVDMGAFEGPDAGGSQQPGEYVGPAGGSWFDPNHWAGGAIPGAGTNVIIPTAVVIDAFGATAGMVLIENGGNLVLTTGSLATDTLTVELGGMLTLDDADALLELTNLTLFGSAQLVWNAGTLRIDAGTWAQSSPLTFGHIGSALLVVLNDATITVPELIIDSQGVAEVDGSLITNVTNGGSLSPGASIGTALISGAFTQTSDGTLVIESQGYLPDSGYDVLQVDGAIALDGTLHLEVLQGFETEVMGRFNVLQSELAPITGRFSNITLPTLPGTLTFIYEIPNTTLRSILTTLEQTGPRLYVDQKAAPNGDGQAWVSSLRTVQEALELAAHFSDQVDEIWVARGIYRPDRGSGDRAASFRVLEDWQIYGGFAGGETDPSKRNITANPTVLSGDLAGDDQAGFLNNGENSYHVLRIKGSTADNFRLDGFIIRGGNADHAVDQNDRRGGGILGGADGALIVNCAFASNVAALQGGALYAAEMMTIADCSFDSNRASHGGAAAIVGRGPTFTGCSFTMNTLAVQGGGAVWCYVADAVFQGCSFIGNSAPDGGAILIENFSNVTFADCVFIGNITSTGSGHGGAICIDETADPIAVILERCSFEANEAQRGGAIWFDADLSADDCDFIMNMADHGGGVLALLDQDDDAQMLNSRFVGNLAGIAGGAIEIDTGTLRLEGCRVEANESPAGAGVFLGHSLSSLQVLDTDFLDNTGSAVLNNQVVYGTGTVGPFDSFDNHRAFSPGFDGVLGSRIGAWTIEGTYRHGVASPRAATLLVEIAGLTAGTEHDVINATSGAIELNGGGMFVDFIDGFEPMHGDVFDVMPSSLVSGTFDVVSVAGLTANRLIDIEYGSDGISLHTSLLVDPPVFSTPIDASVPDEPTSGILTDVDNDGWPDLVLTTEAANEDGHLVVLLNGGIGGTGAWLGFSGGMTSLPIVDEPDSMAAADFDGDGFTDVILGSRGNSVAQVIRNTGANGVFVIDANYFGGNGATGVSVGLIDQDASVDFVVAGSTSDRVRVYLNDGAGGFSQVSMVAPDNPERTVLADVSGDNIVDLIVAHSGTTEALITVYRGVGNGFFNSAQSYASVIDPISITLADLNLDGFNDIASLQPNGTASILVNSGDGLGTFHHGVPTPAPGDGRSMIPFDLDQDGDPDLAMVARDAAAEFRVHLVRNDILQTEDLILVHTDDLGASSEPRLVMSADVNLDGLEDLVTANVSTTPGPAGGSVSSLLNLSASSGSAPLTDFTIIFGALLSGDLGELAASDDQYLEIRSQFGFSAVEPNIVQMVVGAETSQSAAALIDLSIESRLNNPGGIAHVAIKNFSRGQFESIHSYPVGQTESVETVNNIDAVERVGPDGRIELQLRNSVIATFTATGFDAFFDWVDVMVR